MAEHDRLRPFAHAKSFEWDDNKRRSNVVKHGIDFADAREVFFDPAAYTFSSPKAANEARYVTVGLMRGVLVAVVSTFRGEVVRIISARAARRSERNKYGESKKAAP